MADKLITHYRKTGFMKVTS